MGGERIVRGDRKNKESVVESHQSFNKASSILSITVLVVDDDSTSLSIVSGLLKTWKYKVATVKTSVDALSTLRVHSNIDLVVTDLHMPGMNGIELQKQIDEEFKLPVVIMSSDDSESMIYKSLASGAAFYIVKPVNPADLKNVWQYAIGSKKGKSIVIEEIPTSLSSSLRSSQDQTISDTHLEDMNSSSSVINEERRGRMACKRKSPPEKTREEEEEEEEHTVAPKRAKVVWCNSLHSRFLQAMRHIGLDKAVPKKILEFMDVPGLTRENVASHLQKYRMFLRRVAERGIASSKVLSDRALRSSFAVGHASLLLNNPQSEYLKFMDPQRLRTTLFQPPAAGLGRSTTLSTTLAAPAAATVPGLMLPCRQDQASSSKSVSQLGYGSSHSNLLGGRADFHQSMLIGNTNSLYNQVNRPTFGIESNNNINFGGNYLSSYGLMNTANPMSSAMYQKQSTQATRPAVHLYNSGIVGINQSNIGTSNTTGPYAGIRINTNGEITEAGQMRPSGAAGFGFMNGIHNDNMMRTTTVAPPGNNWTNAFGYNYSAQQQAAAAASSTTVGFENISANLFQVQPTVLNTVSQQQNSSMLAPQPQELNNGVGENDLSSFGRMNINASDHDFGDINIDPLLKFAEVNLDDIIFDPNNYEFIFQKQGVGEGVMNPELPNSSNNVGENPLQNPEISNGSNNVEENPMNNQLMNPQVPDATFPVEENAPWNEQALSQLQNGTGEQVINPAVDLENYYPIFDQNFNEQQGRGPGGDLMNFGFDGLNAMDNIIGSSENVASVNQDWGDEYFMDSLFNSGPYN